MQVQLQPLPQEVSNLLAAWGPQGILYEQLLCSYPIYYIFPQLSFLAFLSLSIGVAPSNKTSGSPFSGGLWKNKTGETLARASKWVKVGSKNKKVRTKGGYRAKQPIKHPALPEGIQGSSRSFWDPSLGLLPLGAMAGELGWSEEAIKEIPQFHRVGTEVFFRLYPASK